MDWSGMPYAKHELAELRAIFALLIALIAVGSWALTH